MQSFLVVCGSGLRKSLTCMLDLEVNYWENGTVTGETFKLIGKH